MNLSRLNAIMLYDVLLCSLRNSDDGVSFAAEQRHRQIQIPIVKLFMMFGKQFEDQIMNGQDSWHISQRHQ